MKFVSFNVNSIRVRMHQLAAVIEKHQPDVIGLQETKVTDEDFPLADIEALGYHAIFHGQKTHYGVAILTRTKPTWSEKGFAGEGEDAQRRFVGCGVECTSTGREFIVLNGYFPQGESRDHPKKFPAKAEFYRNITARAAHAIKLNQPVIVMGDMNVAPTDQDIGIGADNAKRWLKTGKCSFLPEEREWLSTLMALNLKDSYRELFPKDVSEKGASELAAQDVGEIDQEEQNTDSDVPLFSWFDYRSRGFERQPKRGLRIDLILATPDLLIENGRAGIDYDIRGMEKPSDHCPIWFECC